MGRAAQDARHETPGFPAADALLTFLTAISGVRDELERVRLTATFVPSALPCRLSGIALRDHADGCWRLRAQVGERLVHEDRTGELLDAARPFFDAAFGQPPLLFVGPKQPRESQPLPAVFAAEHVDSLLLAPLMTRHHKLGVLFVGHRESRDFSREDQMFLSTLAEQTAVGIENLRLHAQLEERRRELEASATRFRSLYNDTPVMMHSIDIEGRLLSVNEHWLRTLGYAEDEVLGRPSVDFLTEASRCRAVEVDIPDMLETGSAHELEYQMIKNDGEVIDVLLSARFHRAALEGERDQSAAFIVDITERKRLRQALQAANEELESKVEERTAALRESRDRLQELSTKQRALLAINHAISSQLRRDQLFSGIAESMRQAVTFDRMAVFTPRPDDDDLEVYSTEAATQGPSLHQGATFPLGDTAPGWALTSRETVVGGKLDDYRRFPKSHQVLRDEGIESVCAVPLISKDQCIGVLVLYDKKQDNFAAGKAELVREIGDAVAIALDRCLVHEEIEALKAKLEQENVYLQEEIKTRHNFEEIIGESAAIREVLAAVETVAPTNANVLITGETGTGKELIARALHDSSERKDRPLIKVNCATIPKDLFESEFFGHVKGAFTGAQKSRAGRFELADESTLFLDEVGEIPIDMQSKLLRVLQERQFERVGDERTRTVDVRIVAATNRDLDEEVEHGRFRQDLYYRLNVFPIHVAPLRERASDILLLAKHFAARAAAEMKCDVPRWADSETTALQAYAWPGNVRELQNVIERAVIAARAGKLRIDVPTGQGVAGEGSVERPDRAPPSSPPSSLAEVEKQHILHALEANDGNKSKTARELGIDPKTLYKRLREYGVIPEQK